MSLQTKLSAVGLNEKEIKIYLALLKHGRTLPAALARITKINRATVYAVAKALQSKGLIAEDLNGSSRYLVPLPAENLEQLVSGERRELQKKEKLIRDIVGDVSLISAEKTYAVPIVRFVQEGDVEQFLFNNTVTWQKSALAQDGIWWGFQDPSFVETFEDWIHSTWETTESKNPKFKAQVVSNESDMERKLGRLYKKEKRNIAVFPGMNFTSTVWVTGEYLVLVMTRQHPHYLFEIRDETLAHNMREVFKKLWASGSGQSSEAGHSGANKGTLRT